jgi:hypothetical protein
VEHRSDVSAFITGYLAQVCRIGSLQSLARTMVRLLNYPLIVLTASLVLFWLSAWLGGCLHAKHWIVLDEKNAEDFRFVLGSALTLLGLIIGFTFSMAVSRYDQRKSCEEQEANAIGTEYARATLLPSVYQAKVRGLLVSYLDQRIVNYLARDPEKLREAGVRTAQLQDEMWSAVAAPATAQPTVIVGLAVSGMNDVLNSQGYTQAAWSNRIPRAAWILMMGISIFCNLLLGYSAKGRHGLMLLLLPIVLALSMFLIADIDSPRHGVILVRPENLELLAGSLHSGS